MDSHLEGHLDDPGPAPALAVLAEIGELGPVRREMLKCLAPELLAGAATVVWHLHESGPLRLSDLAGVLHLDVSVVSRQVTELAAAGHVERHPDPADRRACVVALAPSGYALVDAAVERVLARFGHQLSGWDDEHLLRIASDLPRLRADLLTDHPAPIDLRPHVVAGAALT